MEELIKRILDGNSAAFDELYKFFTTKKHIEE